MNAQNINEILDALAARFGTTGMHLWEVFVRQQVIMSVVGFVSLIGFGVAFALIVHYGQKSDTSWDDPFPYAIPAIICGMVALGSVFFCIFSGVPMLLNPEFYALKELWPGR